MEDSRGQIILVAALAIAVTFVALALIVNTVIFTENLATRETVSGKEAVLFQQNAIESGGELLERANRYNNSSYDELWNTFERDIGVLSESENLHAVSGGGLREIEIVSITNGTRIEQTTSQPLNDTDDRGNWTIADSVSRTKNFVMEFSSDSPRFRLKVTGGSSSWAIGVSSGNVQIYDDGVNVGTCSATLPASVNLSNGSVDGSDCPDLEFAEGVPTPYSIRIENGSQVDATYQLIVDQDRGEIAGSPYDGSNAEPTAERLIYNSTLQVRYQRHDLNYSSTVSVETAG